MNMTNRHVLGIYLILGIKLKEARKVIPFKILKKD